jgi:hypothetical protein
MDRKLDKVGQTKQTEPKSYQKYMEYLSPSCTAKKIVKETYFHSTLYDSIYSGININKIIIQMI